MSIIQIDANDPAFASGFAGASVSWELTDTIEHADLCKALTDNGLGYLPEPCSPASALHRLISDLHQSRSCLVKPASNPVKGSKKPAYAVLPRKDEEARMAFVESWSVGLAQRADGSFYLVFSDTAPDDAQDEINLLYPTALEQLGRPEQSIWLSHFVKAALHGVPTIGGAGTYFIGPQEVQVWRKLRTVLSKYGVRLYEIPAMKSDQALECVIESVKRYTTTALEELQADYTKYADMQQKIEAGEEGVRKIQQRAMDSRLEKLNHQLTVVEKYETLFDTKLPALREQIMSLRAGFASMSIATD